MNNHIFLIFLKILYIFQYSYITYRITYVICAS